MSERVVTGNYEVHCALTDKRTVKITGVIYSDTNAEALSYAVDMAQNEVDRQMVRCDVKLKEAQIVGFKENLARMRESTDGLIQKKKTGKLTSQEKVTLDAADTNMQNELKRIESLIAAVAEGKKKLGL